jgi:hypothetical protein
MAAHGVARMTRVREVKIRTGGSTPGPSSGFFNPPYSFRTILDGASMPAPCSAKTYLGGPVYYIAALGTAIYALFGVYEYLTVPAFFLNSPLGYEVTFVPLVILFVIYFVARSVNKSRGVEFDKIFSQIPLE